VRLLFPPLTRRATRSPFLRSMKSSPFNPPPPPEDPIREHVYDGIQEYDKRLPNWWLNTLYITIVFWVGYWAYYEWLRVGPSGTEVVDTAMAKIAAERLSAATIDDESLWQMSRNAAFVEA